MLLDGYGRYAMYLLRYVFAAICFCCGMYLYDDRGNLSKMDVNSIPKDIRKPPLHLDLIQNLEQRLCPCPSTSSKWQSFYIYIQSMQRKTDRAVQSGTIPTRSI